MSLFLTIKNRFLKWGKPAADTLVDALGGLDTRVTALEEGGSGGGDSFILTFNEQTNALDQTWLEIATALSEGKRVIMVSTDHMNNASNQSMILNAECKSASDYRIWFLSIDTENGVVETYSVKTTSENGHPGDAM